MVSGSRSEKHCLTCGVPQGSVMGPIPFTTYTTPLSDVIDQFSLDKHMYADDSQLYLAFSPSAPSSVSSAIEGIHCCARAIKSWMSRHFLKLNEDKTEVLVVTTPTLARELSLLSH